ncbi:MAG: 16S rRNA (guanine(527)-N(7))-methyltransferase RsmG [Bacteroidota bacterium]|nr:16S rRNA (guanine(527)-N(7))-methyltransferase RsmG [Bacteroidota bacterium]
MDSILKYFPDLSSDQQNQFAQLGELYKNWNEKINVISRKDISNLYERHILHSLAIAKVIEFAPGTKILDVGTGGGFPGIPLAILFPTCHFYLIDAIRKKIKVVNAVSEEIGLQNMIAEHANAEFLIGKKYDFVISRAVTRMPVFMNWVKNNVGRESNNSLSNGILSLKGGNLEGELQGIKCFSEIYPISEFFSEEFFDTKKVVYVKV